jgi:hypothetical protein
MEARMATAAATPGFSPLDWENGILTFPKYMVKCTRIAVNEAEMGTVRGTSFRNIPNNIGKKAAEK